MRYPSLILPPTHLLARTIPALILWLTLVSSLATATAQTPPVFPSFTFPLAQPAEPIFQTEAQWSSTGLSADSDERTISLALTLIIPKGWHTQVHRPSEKWMIPTTFTLEGLPEGVRYGDIQTPKPHAITANFSGTSETVDVYDGRATFFTKLSVPKTLSPGTYPLTATLSWQPCNDTSCLPMKQADIPLTLTVHPAGTPSEPMNTDLFAHYQFDATQQTDALVFHFFQWTIQLDQASLIPILLLAMIGGFLLNLTPCVLPLIPIKIMGLAQSASNRGRCLFLGSMMSLGVILFWLILGLAISQFSYLTSTNELFQMPAFTMIVGLVIAMMAIGMCGLFSLRLPQWIYRINPKHDSVHGAIGFGMMTAVLSTPCTAPLMGTAAAWSTTQSPAITLTTFAAIGLGMALPYLILSAFPSLVDRMPRTGPASQLIKQIMGLLMLAAAAYFLGTGLSGLLATPPAPPTRQYWWGVGLFILLAGLWLIWQTWRLTPSLSKRFIFGIIGLFLSTIAISVPLSLTATSPIRWSYYTDTLLAEAHANGEIVVLEFTAEWCLNCHVLESTVLSNDCVVERLNRPGVRPIKVDITGNNPMGNAKLVELGRRTIPYLVIFDAKGQPVFQSDAYTVDQIVGTIDKLRPPQPDEKSTCPPEKHQAK